MRNLVMMLMSGLLVMMGVQPAFAEDASGTAAGETVEQQQNVDEKVDGNADAGDGSSDEKKDEGSEALVDEPAPEEEAPEEVVPEEKNVANQDDDVEKKNEEEAPSTQKRSLSASAAPAEVAPALEPTNSSTVVRINKSVLRGKTDYLAGATFRLETNASSPDRPSGTQVSGTRTCTIASGETSCDISVPNTQNGGANYNQRYWVVETTPAPGTYSIPEIAVGSGGNVTTSLYYPGRTSQLQAGQMVNMPLAGSGTSTSIGKTVNAIDNPGLQATCDAGLDIILVLDKSGSIAENQRDAYAKGLETLVDSLTGTGSRMSVITFNSSATVRKTLAPVDATLRSDLRTLVTTGTFANATNWDDGFTKANDLGGDYDLTIFVTDGAPNQNRNGDSNPVIRSLENGVLSANELKNRDIPMLGVGVGNALTNPTSGNLARTNLAAVSGQTEDTDFFIGEWEELGKKLEAIADAATCKVPIEVKKQIVDANGGNATAGVGWDMTVAVTPDPQGSAALDPTSATQPTDNAGVADWKLDFKSLDAQASLSVSEDLASKAGYSFYGGSCTITHSDGKTTTQDLTGPSTTLTGVVPTDKGVSCVFQNTEVPKEPKWTLEKSSKPGTGTTVNPGTDIEYTLKVKNTGPIATKIDVEDDLSQVLNNATVKSGPTASAGTANITGNKLTWSIASLATDAEATVTYTVTVKSDAHGVTLKNVATPKSPGGECVEEGGCETT
ncbi:MAG: VWA domain-containing protein, partial [Leucobacter sp.]